MLKKSYLYFIVLLGISGIYIEEPALAVSPQEGHKVLRSSRCELSDLTKLLKSWTRDNALSLISCISSPVLKYQVVPGGGYGDNRDYGPHLAVDYAAPVGTKVLAIFNGLVSKVFNSPLCGDGVEINNGIYRQLACHVKAIVNVGQSVLAGQPIGVINLSGRTTGAHAHIQVTVDGKPVDPEKLLRDPDQIRQLIASTIKNGSQDGNFENKDLANGIDITDTIEEKIRTEKEAWIALNKIKNEDGKYSDSQDFSISISKAREVLQYEQQLENEFASYYIQNIRGHQQVNKRLEDINHINQTQKKEISSTVPLLSLY